MTKKVLALILLTAVAGTAAGLQAGPEKKRFGAPTEDMTREEYQSLVFLDPQNTVRVDWDAVKGLDGYFLIDNQGDPTVSVVDYKQEKTIKKIDMGETGNHHLWIIPGGRYAWSSQRYEKDVMWTIDLTTLKVIDKFKLSRDGKQILAPLHIGFAYTRPLAATGNILDKENGYVTLLSTATRKPVATIATSCPGVRDALFTLDDTTISQPASKNRKA